MFEAVTTVASEFWNVLSAMAPYLLFGFFVAGLLSVVISPEFVERHLGGRKIMSVIKAAVFGIPLPLCSCGVIPVAASLRRHGAGRGATTAFLLSTPQTGVDSISVTFSLLGLGFTIFRLLAALVCGILGGMFVTIFDPKDEKAGEVEPAQCNDVCCSHDGKSNRIVRALKYGFITLPRDIGWSLFIGLVIAGLIAAVVPGNFFADVLGKGIVAMLVMMLLGIPIYVCATASVPIAAALIIKGGVSPGAALAFLMTGPVTNAAAITTIWKIMGKRTTLIYLFTVAVSALGAGLFLDNVVGLNNDAVVPGMHQMMPDLFNYAAALILVAVLAAALFRRQEKETAEESGDTGADTSTISISGMHCSHCVESIEHNLSETEGVESVKVSLKNHNAFITGKGYDISLLRRKVEELGYKVTNM